MTMSDATAFLMGGAPSASFKDQPIGYTISGTITEPPEVSQQTDYDDGTPLFWADGKPKLQLRVLLATQLRDPADPTDEGERALYIKGQMQQAVKAAVKAAGASAVGLEVGGTLSVTYASDGEQHDKKKNKPKIYKAAYVKPNLLDQVAPPAAAQVPVAQSVPQPAAAPTVDMAALIAQMQAAQAPAAPAMPACPPGVDPAGWPAMWQAMTPEQQATLLAALGAR